jgi:hypothetical protein
MMVLKQNQYPNSAFVGASVIEDNGPSGWVGWILIVLGNSECEASRGYGRMQQMQHHLNNMKNHGRPSFCVIAFNADGRRRQQMQH